MVDPFTAGAAVVTGFKLVKQSVDFIKTNISTAQDIGQLLGHIDKAMVGEQQALKAREKAGADPFAVENVAQEVIDARLAKEALYDLSQLIDHRFGHGTWKFILAERKKRIDAKKQAIKEAKAKKLKQQKEMYDMIRMGFIVLAVVGFIALAIGITVKIVLAHSIIEGDHESCMLYEPKYFMICMNEGRGYADTELYLDYKKMRDNWIVDDAEK
tara:strand:+ start:121 stop:762 length:642 start_codon:yes stop_codon:yes gene_type:complete